jgi:hypothetical protein
MGIALANVTGQNNTANLRLVDQSGNTMAVWPVNLSPFGQNAFSVASVPAVAAVLTPGIDFIGTLTVSSIAPLTALALGDDLGPFFSVPPVPGSAAAPPSTTLRSLAISPAGAVLGVGQTRQFNVLGTYSDGALRDVTATVTWNSSASSVAGVSSSGIVSGAAAGTANISAQLNGVSGSAPVTVRVGGAPACVLTGNWTGTWNILQNGNTGTIALTLTQTTSSFGASSVSGTVSTHNIVNGHDHSGVIFGTFHDGVFTFTPIALDNGFAMGVGTLNASCTGMSGNFEGTKFSFGEVDGSFAAAKQ